MVRNPQPLLGNRFRVDLGDGKAARGFSEVIFPEFIACRQDDARLVLRRAATGDLDVYRWWTAARDTPGASPIRPFARSPRENTVARDVTIQLLPASGEESVMSWLFKSAEPVALGYTPLDANLPAILLESLTLAFERMEMA